MKLNQNNLKAVADRLKSPEFDGVLVACHRSPDGDACGSAHALVWALRKLGKKAAVFCPDPFGKDFSYLTQWEENEKLENPRCFVTVDVADPAMLCGAPFADSPDVVIDHHKMNSVAGKMKYVDADSASCGEIVLDLLDALSVEPDRRIALAIYTAIATDTGLCRFSNTNERTFLALARLSRFAEKGDFYRINKLLFETKSYARLSLESYGIRQMRFAAEGKIAYLMLTREEQARLGADYEELSSLVQVLRQVEGVLVAMVIKERDPGEFKVSVRSEAPFDAAAFCALFGGGGHTAAAGCSLRGEAQEVLNSLLVRAEGVLS